MLTVQCHCGKRYKVADDWVGKRVRCKSCGQVFRVKAPEAPADDRLTLLPLDDMDASVATLAASTSAATAVAVSPAKDEAATERRTQVGGPGGLASYWKDCLGAFAFFINPGNLITFLFLAGIASLQVLLPYLAMGSCAGGMLWVGGHVIINGWIIAFVFNTVVNAASGDRDLPDLSLSEGLVDGAVVPLLQFLATWAFVLAPAILYASLVRGGFTLPSGEVDPIVIGLGALGIFFWPIAILIVALGGVATFGRPDLIIRTVARTFLPYLSTVVLTVVAFGITYAVRFLAVSGGTALGNHPLILSMVLYIPTIYAWIVASLVIGLYYHHFKQRFAWSWG